MMIFGVFLLLTLAFDTCHAQKSAPLPIPRFVSLRSNNVNVHVGPGKNYPVEWKYVRMNLPVEIIAEFDTWRKIRDVDGTETWVHKSLLSSKRHGIVLQKIRNLRDTPEDNSKVRAKLEPGVLIKLIECTTGWCKVEAQKDTSKYKGWLKRSALWGVYPEESKFK
jgi:SH3-like domain-containing protein